MHITPDKEMDKAFLKAGDKVPICRSVLSREGTVHFQHNYMCQLKHCQHLASILQTISYKCSVSIGYTIYAHPSLSYWRFH